MTITPKQFLEKTESKRKTIEAQTMPLNELSVGGRRDQSYQHDNTAKQGCQDYCILKSNTSQYIALVIRIT